MIIKVNYTVSDIYMSTSVSPVYIKVVYSGTSSGGGTWGTITGTLSNQTDLQDALDDKVPYTGATGAVNLGAYNLTVNGLTIGKGLAGLSNNTALGYQSLFHVTTGNFNTAAGYQSLHNITTGQYNTALGQSSMFTATTAAQNVAIGLNALLYTTSGGSNVVVGLDGLMHNTTGSSNTAIGYNAGTHITGGATPNTTASNSVFIGRDSKAAADGQTNQIVIGQNAVGNGSNTATFGNTATTANYFTGSVNAGSFVKSGGTSAQFLKADGSVDSSSYVTSNIYTANGTLTSARTLTQGGFNLDFIGSIYTNRFTSAGRLLIGNGTESTFQLDVNGSARVTSNLFLNLDTYLTASDDIGNRPRITFGTTGIFDKNWTFVPNTSGGILVANAYGTISSLSAIFEIASNTRGFLPPRMTTTQRDAIVSPATGLQIYNTTTLANNVYNGTSWVGVGSLSIGDTIASATAGSVLFAGVGGILQQDNANFFWDDTNNRLGIGTTSPSGSLDIRGNVNGVISFAVANSNTGSGAATAFQIGQTPSSAPYNALYFVNYGSGWTTTGSAIANSNAFTSGVGSTGGLSFVVDAENAPIRFYARNSGTQVQKLQMFTTGNFVLQNGGTFADLGYRLDVQGTARVSGDALVNGLTIGKGNGSLSENSAFGFTALANDTGNSHAAFGYLALNANTSGQANTAIGRRSLEKNTTGSFNTGIGSNSLQANTTGSQNMAMGSASLISNTTGSSNVGIGRSSLYSNIGGINNVAISFEAMYTNAAGNYNIAIGYTALRANNSDGNVAIGYIALNKATSAYNTATGFAASFENTSGTKNTSYGSESLKNISTASNNTAIGANSGRYISSGTTANTTSANSTYLGSESRASADGNTNEIVIGYNAIGAGSNSVTLGNTSITKTILRGTLNAANLPTSPTGLNAGDIWNNLGILTIV